MQHKTFTNYGIGFQIKSLAMLIADSQFLSTVFEVIDEKYYENESFKFILRLIISYFKEYKTSPTIDVVRHGVVECDNHILKNEMLTFLKNIENSLYIEDADYIKKSVIEFCKSQEMRLALWKSVNFLKNGQFENIELEIKRAAGVGIDSNIGHEYLKDTKYRYEENQRNAIPTPWKVINDLTKGGLGSGDLGCIMGLPKMGKSWFLCALGAHAMLNGIPVLHYTLELKDVYLGRRYDSILTKIPLDQLDDRAAEVKQQLTRIDGKLLIKGYYPGMVSPFGLRNHIDKAIRSGFTPGMILIDYADLLSLSPYDGDFRHKIDALYQDLKSIGGDYSCPVWTLSQLNRSSLNKDYVDSLEGSAEAASKNNAPDFIMTFSRPENFREINGLYAYVSGNRYGEDKVKLVGHMDTSIGEIELYDRNSTEASSILNRIPSDNDMTQDFIRRNAELLTEVSAPTPPVIENGVDALLNLRRF